jgi:cytochrome c-type biogenesis protein
MEAFLSELYAGTSIPIVAAFLLGLMTAISPCPLATNITAMGFISKKLSSQKQVFINGLLYTGGRAFSYFFLALVLFIGADQFEISGWFQKYGERFLGPLLIIIGLFMLGIIPIHFNLNNSWFNKNIKEGKGNFWQVFLLGVVFALAFCPYSGVLYFGMLMPMTIQNSYGLLLPLVFAFATGIPVIIFAWLLAYTLSGVGNFYNKLKAFELWFRRAVAILFIGFGVYYTYLIYFN